MAPFFGTTDIPIGGESLRWNANAKFENDGAKYRDPFQLHFHVAVPDFASSDLTGLPFDLSSGSNATFW